MRTIRLKLQVNDQETWDQVHQFINKTWKAANIIISGQYLNDMMMRRVYARRGIDPKNKEQVQLIEQEFYDFFGTKRQATTDRDAKAVFKDLPSCIRNTLNNSLYSKYNKDKKDILIGNKSLQTYKRNMPVPFSKASVELFADEQQEHWVRFKLKRQHCLEMKIFYGKDRANFKHTVTQILNGRIEHSACQLQYKDKRLYLLLPVRDDYPQSAKKDCVVGVDLGIAIPAYAAVYPGHARKSIGDINDFLKTRLHMQSRKRRIAKSVTTAHGGKGRKKKLKALYAIRDKERRFAQTYNHFISKNIIDFALQHDASEIKMEKLTGFNKQKILRNWSYFELQSMVEYKAKRHGIQVHYVDPAYTSQTCSICGNVDADQRHQRDFYCSKCNTRLHADYNAAINIAKAAPLTKDARLGSQPDGVVELAIADAT